MPDSASYYQKQRLGSDSRCIRLLRLHLDHSCNDGPAIVGTMMVASLDDTNMTFAALSYVWGAPPGPGLQTHAILCDGFALPVTANCWSAVKHLLDIYGALPPLWIDAVCIYQQDLAEKSFQVPLMRDIYSRAETVYVWLGEGSDTTRREMAALRTAGFQGLLQVEDGGLEYKKLESKEAKKLGSKISWRLAKEHTRLFYRSFWGRSKEFRRQYDNRWLADFNVEELLNKELLARVWTLQEILLSQRPLLVCGHDVLPWRCLVYSLTYIHRVMAKYPSSNSMNACYRWLAVIALWQRLQHPHNNMASDSDEAPDVLKLESFRSAQIRAYICFIDNILFWYKPYRRFMSPIVWILGLGIVASVPICVKLGPHRPRMAPLLGILFLFFMIGLIVAQDDARDDAKHLSSLCTSEALVYEMSMRTATNPKDICYGMYSVLQKLGLSPLPVDYTRDTVDIYRGHFKCLALWTNSLNNILFCNSAQAMPGQKESWVPNWNVAAESQWLPVGFLSTTRKLSSAPNCDFTFTDKKTILAQSRILGRIQRLWGPLLAYYDEDDDQADLENMTIIRSLLKPFNIQSFMVLKMDKREFFDTSEWERWKRLMRRLPEDQPTALAQIRASAIHLDMFRRVCNGLATCQRSLFYTGRRIGNCPSSSQIGDSLAFIPGVNMPLILRHATNISYRTIGFADIGLELDNVSKDKYGKIKRYKNDGFLLGLLAARGRFKTIEIV